MIEPGTATKTSPILPNIGPSKGLLTPELPAGVAVTSLGLHQFDFFLGPILFPPLSLH